MAVGTGVYRVTGRNEIFILENNEWRYVPTEQALFNAGYSWADVQVIPVEEWCKYEVGSPMPAPGWPTYRGYCPHKDWYVSACAVSPPLPPPPPPTYSCPSCPATFGSQAELHHHIDTVHPYVPPPPPPNGNGTRASIDLIAYPWTPGRDEATIRSQYETLLSLGMNAFEAGWGNWPREYWDKGTGVEVIVDLIYNLAAEYGIKVYWMTSIHRLPWINLDTGETFVGRYKNFPACAGWSYADEPALKHYDHFDNWNEEQQKWNWGCVTAKNWINSQDPNHPVNPVFSADLETDHYMRTMHPAWGDLYDVSCTDIYPHARASGGDDWKGFLAYRSQLTYRYTGKAPYWGFEHWQPRNHIAVVQAFQAGSTVDIVGQYNILKNGGVGGGLTFAGWGDRLKGIAFYQAPLFASGGFADMIRGQIKDLARLLGWQERPDEVITPKTIIHSCNVKISYQLSSFAENNDPLTCLNCGMALGIEGIRGSEEIVEVIEVVTPHIITCGKCGSQLKLSVSSIAEKNTEQFCPVCGEPAD